MPVYLARSECRGGHWHVVTYDISDPDHWSEIGDIETPQECSNELTLAFQLSPPESETAAVDAHVRRHHQHLSAGGAGALISSGGHLVSLEHSEKMVVLAHRDADGETVETTCSGACTKPDGTVVKVGPKPCPSGNGGIDCTTDPPTLICT